MRNSLNIKELTYISLGVAIIIAGGLGILQMSMIFPIPGTKYILMAPYLSMVFTVIQSRLKSKVVLIKTGITFGGIMLLINLYMGITICLTSFLAQATAWVIPTRNKAFWGSVLFSFYMGICALAVSKYLVGGVFLQISSLWMLATGIICFIFGIAGAVYANRIMTYLSRHVIDN